jgi:predicted DNA-binding transcriptional regulator AlpA
MLDTTKQAVTAIIKADPTLNTNDRVRLIALLDKGDKQPDTAPVRIMKRREVAALVGRSTRTIDLWRKAGLLKPVQLPGHSRALGFRLSEVQKLVGG